MAEVAVPNSSISYSFVMAKEPFPDFSFVSAKEPVHDYRVSYSFILAKEAVPDSSVSILPHHGQEGHS